MYLSSNTEFVCRYIGNANKLALFLDYDGALAPLALHPDLAILPSETKSVLERLAIIPGLYISIISGRSVKNVKEMVSYCKFNFKICQINAKWL